jgi:hypothetical protein
VHPAQGRPGMIAKRKVVPRAQVGKVMVRPIRPQSFHRVEFRRISRELLNDDPSSLPGQVLPDQPSAVAGLAVPDGQQLSRHTTREVPQKTDHLRAPGRPRIETEVEVPQGDPGDGRARLPVEVILEHRGLPTRGPGPNPVRAFAQPTLVREDDDSALARCVLFGAGQRFSFQRWIACSSRSSACPVGRCTLQPRSRRMRQT